jgi:hypothetical protein
MHPIMAQDLIDSVDAECCQCKGKGKLMPILEEAKLFETHTDTQSEPDVTWSVFAQCDKCKERWIYTFVESGNARYNSYDRPTDPNKRGVILRIDTESKWLGKA